MGKNIDRRLVLFILIGLVAGAVTGPVVHAISESLFTQLDEYVFSLLGDLFMRAISLLVIPIILFSLAVGTANVGNPRQLGRMGLQTVALYLTTTIIAIVIGLTLGNVFQPGVGIERSHNGDEVVVEDDFNAMDTLYSIIPENPVNALAEGNVLGTIFLALFLGLSLAALGDKAKLVHQALEQGQSIVMFMIGKVMYTAPLGVFGLMASAVGSTGIEVVAGIAQYTLLGVVGIIAQMTVVYMTLLLIFVRLSPVTFYRKIAQPLLIGFSTSSSSATLPVTLETVEEELGVDNDVASFVVPLGATLNMDGTALIQGLATMFIAQAYGIDLNLGQQVLVVAMATSVSIGTAGVPGVGVIMLAMILRSLSLPVEGIGLILGVDRILDMVRSAKNIAGDAVVSLIVAHSEGKLDRDTFTE